MIVRRTYEFQASIDTVTESLMERFVQDPAVMLNTPDLKGCRMLERRDNGDTVALTVQYSAYSQIPKMVQHLLTPEMLTWISRGLWNRPKRTYSFDVETAYFTKQVSCRGVQQFVAAGNDKTLQKMEMKLRISIPLFGPFIEKEIARLFVANLDAGYQIARKIVEDGLLPDMQPMPGASGA